MQFDHPEFLLHLGGDWRRAEDPSGEQFDFISDEQQSVVVVSVINAQVPADKLLAAADALARMRQDAEREAVPGRIVTFGDCWTEMSDDMGHAAYAGYDNAGTIFRFMGWTTTHKLLSLWVSTRTNDNNESKRVFDEVFAGFRFYVP